VLLLCVLLQNPKVTEDRAFNGFGTNFENSPEPIYGTQVGSSLRVLYVHCIRWLHGALCGGFLLGVQQQQQQHQIHSTLCMVFDTCCSGKS
jgi:hypothetical protein